MKDGEERVYTIPLRKGYVKKPRWRKTHFASKQLKKFVTKHAKLVPKIDKDLNEEIWKKGGKNPPARIKVRITAKQGFAETTLADKKVEEVKEEDKKGKKEDKKIKKDKTRKKK